MTVVSIDTGCVSLRSACQCPSGDANKCKTTFVFGVTAVPDPSSTSGQAICVCLFSDHLSDYEVRESQNLVQSSSFLRFRKEFRPFANLLSSVVVIVIHGHFIDHTSYTTVQCSWATFQMAFFPFCRSLSKIHFMTLVSTYNPACIAV